MPKTPHEYVKSIADDVITATVDVRRAIDSLDLAAVEQSRTRMDCAVATFNNELFKLTAQPDTFENPDLAIAPRR